ncbi:MAG TPA: hypothetical protein VHO25_03160 [Polyangiaceae bacterium]|nr:hypothetical protein [Polyangiaceae bacterium]
MGAHKLLAIAALIALCTLTGCQKAKRPKPPTPYVAPTSSGPSTLTREEHLNRLLAQATTDVERDVLQVSIAAASCRGLVLERSRECYATAAIKARQLLARLPESPARERVQFAAEECERRSAIP